MTKEDVFARHKAAMDKGNKSMYVHAIVYALLAKLLDSDTVTRQEMIDEMIEKRDIHTDAFARLPYDEAIDLLSNPSQIESVLR